MKNGNVIHGVYSNDNKGRISVYYDRKPSNSAERDRRVCIVLKSSGQKIRFSEAEALELMENISRTLKKKFQRSWH